MGLNKTQRHALLSYVVCTLGQIISLGVTVHQLSSNQALVLHVAQNITSTVPTPTPAGDGNGDGADDDAFVALADGFDHACTIILWDYENHKVGSHFEFGDGKKVSMMGGGPVSDDDAVEKPAQEWHVDPAISGCKTSVLQQADAKSLHVMWVWAIIWKALWSIMLAPAHVFTAKDYAEETGGSAMCCKIRMTIFMHLVDFLYINVFVAPLTSMSSLYAPDVINNVFDPDYATVIVGLFVYSIIFLVIGE
jgi:hypothetical protein